MRAAILLAGGMSRRFGRADKLLAPVAGAPLIAGALAGASAADGGRVIVVIRPRDARLVRWLHGRRRRGLTIVRARDAGSGIAASLRAGLAALRPLEREAWIFLGDMPAARVRRGLRLPAGHDALRPDVQGKPGHPMLVRAAVVRAAVARAAIITGDRGLAAALPRGRVGRWRGDAGNLLDIDDRAALRRHRLRR